MFLYTKLNHPDQLLDKTHPQWFDLGKTLSHIKGVIAISPFWATRTLFYGSTDNRPIRFDFPIRNPRVKRLVFRGNRSPYLARLLTETLQEPVRPKPSRGLDHGVWAPLRMLFPADTIPTVQLSLTPDLTCDHSVIQDLIQLSRQDILILTSGFLSFNAPLLSDDDKNYDTHLHVLRLFHSLADAAHSVVLRDVPGKNASDVYSGESIVSVSF